MRRPSLLTPAQQGEADRNRILSTLEHGRAELPAPAMRRKRWLFAGLGVGVLLVAGAAVFWPSADTTTAAQRVASTTAVPSWSTIAPIQQAPAADAPAVAATIHEEAPAEAAGALAGPSTPGAASAPTSSAGESANGPVLPTALEQPEAKSAPSRHVAAAKPKAKPAARGAPPAVHADSDEALLSAIVAHVQASNTDADEGNLKKELQACRHLKGARGKQCRSEICAKRHKGEKECKAEVVPAPKES